MVKRFLITLAILSLFASLAVAETLTFEWSQPDLTNVKEWKILWGDVQYGPYVEAATAVYDGTPSPTYSTPADLEVTGDQGTHVIKYFVARACGDVPQENGVPVYLCSEDSEEINYDFWIPAGVFSVPLNFIIIPNP